MSLAHGLRLWYFLMAIQFSSYRRVASVAPRCAWGILQSVCVSVFCQFFVVHFWVFSQASQRQCVQYVDALWLRHKVRHVLKQPPACAARLCASRVVRNRCALALKYIYEDYIYHGIKWFTRCLRVPDWPCGRTADRVEYRRPLLAYKWAK